MTRLTRDSDPIPAAKESRPKKKPAYPMDVRVSFIRRYQSRRLSRSNSTLLASSFFSVVSFAALVIILGWLLFRLDNNFGRVLFGWTLLVLSSLLGESASGKEANHRDRQ